MALGTVERSEGWKELTDKSHQTLWGSSAMLAAWFLPLPMQHEDPGFLPIVIKSSGLPSNPREHPLLSVVMKLTDTKSRPGSE
uniref:Uncharacterized protein n=2 Tax=Xiphophorus TaxID=8082 RepID=A0A3B5QR45_XIPMA